MKTGSIRRPLWQRCLIWILLALVALLVLVGLRAVYAFRDRSPGYTLKVDIDGQAARQNPRPLQVGFGRIKINPDLSNPERPIWIAGFNQNRAATSIHDDLWAIACVLDDGHSRLAIAALDAIGLFHDDVIQIRSRLEEEWKVDYAIVCTTHNHSTPDLMGLWGPDYMHTGVDSHYRESVIAATTQAIGQAARSLEPAAVAIHKIDVPSEGLVTDTRKPEVYDPGLRLLYFTDPSGSKTLGSVITWANHPETVWSKNTELTSDFPGYLRTALEEGVKVGDPPREPGLGGIHLYINGAIGGLMSTTPSVEVRDPYLDKIFKEPTHEKARAVGHQLAFRIFSHLRDTPADGTNHLPMAIQARTFLLPLDNVGFLLAPVLGLMDRGHTGWKRIRTEIAVLTLGPAGMVCIPGEIYPELVNGGIEKAPGADYSVDPVEQPPIRDLLPGSVKFVLGLANDEVGYIIPKSQWDVDPPYLYDSKRSVYGEINSLGPDTASHLHKALTELCTQLKSRSAP